MMREVVVHFLVRTKQTVRILSWWSYQYALQNLEIIYIYNCLLNVFKHLLPTGSYSLKRQNQQRKWQFFQCHFILVSICIYLMILSHHWSLETLYDNFSLCLFTKLQIFSIFFCFFSCKFKNIIFCLNCGLPYLSTFLILSFKEGFLFDFMKSK